MTEIKQTDRTWERPKLLLDLVRTNPVQAGALDDAAVLDPTNPSDSKLLRSIEDIKEKVEIEFMLQDSLKERKVKAKEDEKSLKFQREAIQTYLNAIGEDQYKNFKEGDAYSK